MAKKDKGKQRELQLIDQVSESANDIWLAGLAAFEKAQREGSKVFSKLVKEGERVESRTLQVAGNQLDEIRNKAAGTWDKLEGLFEARVERALTSLGVPTGNEIRNLAKRVDNLGKSVESVGTRKKRTTTAKSKTGAAAKPKTRAKTAAATTQRKTRATAAEKAAPAARGKAKSTTKKTASAARLKVKAAKKTAAPATRARAKTAEKKAAPATKARGATRARTTRAKPAVAQGPDDLKLIDGIGPALERKLNANGVTSYRQIASWGSKEIADVEKGIIRIAGRVTRDNWVAQAKAAHQKKYGAKA